jgi:hypothetical protein
MLRRARLAARRRRRAVPADGWLRLRENPEVGWPKSARHVRTYEQVLASFREERFALLELGVAGGDSLAMWRDGFPHATIIGVDIEVPAVNLGPRVHIVQGDQRDGELLTRIRESLAPDGFQVIIDDASHQGTHSARSIQALFVDHLRAGGLYIIEDWRVGYYAPYSAPLTVSALDETAAPDGGEGPMPSHDHGLVGLVKRVVDHLGAETIQATTPDIPFSPLPVESMTITAEMAILRRR